MAKSDTDDTNDTKARYAVAAREMATAAGVVPEGGTVTDADLSPELIAHYLEEGWLVPAAAASDASDASAPAAASASATPAA